MISSHVLLVSLAFLVASRWHRSQVRTEIVGQLRVTTSELARGLLPQLVDIGEEVHDTSVDMLRRRVHELAELVSLRLTVVATDGTVLADSSSDPDLMLNHFSRDELVAAAAGHEGVAERESPTLGVAMMYFAVPVSDEGKTLAFLRTSLPATVIEERLSPMRSLLFAVLLALGTLSCAIGTFVIGQYGRSLVQLTQHVRRMSSNDVPPSVTFTGHDEVESLSRTINEAQLRSASEIAALTADNERLSTVLANMDDGVLAVNAEARIILVNDMCRKLFEFVTGDTIGRPLLEVTRSRQLNEIVRRCLDSQLPAQAEFESSRYPRRTLNVRATMLPSEKGAGAVVLIQDATELRRLEKVRQDFVTNVSHELKTPLAAIKAYAETLRLGAVNDPANNLGFVERIEEQADRLHALIMDMLQIARVETGREVFEIGDVVVQSTVESSVTQQRSAAEAKQIELRCEPPAQPLTVRADERGLRSILDNLIDNAIKYTPRDGTVDVRWRAEANQLVLEVQDTGLGIAETDQLRVFERFYRVDKARSRELGGTGLGLSIVKHLSHAFGGSVELRSQPGVGSTFIVRLPLGT